MRILTGVNAKAHNLALRPFEFGKTTRWRPLSEVDIDDCGDLPAMSSLILLFLADGSVTEGGFYRDSWVDSDLNTVEPVFWAPLQVERGVCK